MTQHFRKFHNHSRLVFLLVPQKLKEKMMKLFKTEKDIKIKFSFGNLRKAILGEMVKKRDGQGFIFYAIIPAHYTF